MAFTNLLTDDERRLLIDELSTFAPDYVLLNAVAETVEIRANISKDMTEFKARRNKRLAIQQTVPDTPVVAIPPPVKEVAMANVSPPGEVAARVTTPTVEAVKRRLSDSSATLEDINRFIGGKLDNTVRVLKLLWSRGAIGYNGTTYYKL